MHSPVAFEDIISCPMPLMSPRVAQLAVVLVQRHLLAFRNCSRASEVCTFQHQMIPRAFASFDYNWHNEFTCPRAVYVSKRFSFRCTSYVPPDVRSPPCAAGKGYPPQGKNAGGLNELERVQGIIGGQKHAMN